MTENQRIAVLNEVVKTFGKKEWFRDAVVYDSYPTDGQPTLEIKCNYIPLFERRDIKEFASRFNLADRFLQVDRNGKPVE